MSNAVLKQHEGVNAGLTKLLYTVKETAFLLGISTKSVRRLLARGLLKASPALRVKLITRESIEAFAKNTL